MYQYYPAVEYYKIAYRMIRDNIHTIRLSLDEIGVSKKAIGLIHKEKKKGCLVGKPSCPSTKKFTSYVPVFLLLFFQCAQP